MSAHVHKRSNFLIEDILKTECSYRTRNTSTDEACLDDTMDTENNPIYQSNYVIIDNIVNRKNSSQDMMLSVNVSIPDVKSTTSDYDSSNYSYEPTQFISRNALED